MNAKFVKVKCVDSKHPYWININAVASVGINPKGNPELRLCDGNLYVAECSLSEVLKLLEIEG